MSFKVSKNVSVLTRLATWLSLILIFVLLLSACGLLQRETTPTLTPEEPPTAEPTDTQPPPTATEEKPDQSAQLMDKVWVLVGYGEAANPTVVEEGTVVTAVFAGDGRLYGEGGCNNYNTAYELDSPNLSVGPIATTMMACEKGGEQEQAYLAALESAQTYFINEEGRLVLEYDTGAGSDERLVFLEGQTPLTDTQWVLVSYGNPENPTQVHAGTSITGVFNDEGALSGSGGCNTYATTYIVDDEGNMQIGPVALTAMACPTGMEQESAYLDALTKAVSYRIVGPRLEITYDGGVLRFTSTTFPLARTLWTLVALNGGPSAENAPLTMQFVPGEQPNKGTVAGVIACNNYNASYVVNGNNIKIEGLITTRMACAPDVMEIEQSYINILETAETYQILGNQLMIKAPVAEIVLAADRTPLEGTLWRLTTLGEISNPQPPVAGSDFTAQFVRQQDVPTGNMVGSTGCNQYNTTYVATLNEIKINLPTATQNANCPPEISEQEQEYYHALSLAREYTIIGDMLEIPYGDGMVLNYVAVPPTVKPTVDLSPLNGTFWFLISLDGKPILPETQITALYNINSDNFSGSVSGSAGCNNYNANIADGFIIGPVVSTKMACNQPPAIMEQETQYLVMLDNATGFSINGAQMILTTTQGQLVFSATPLQPISDQSVLLKGRVWFLKAVGDRDVVAGSEPTAFFGLDSLLSGTTGCNTYESVYQVQGESMTIGTISTSGQPCGEPQTSQEAAYLASLQGAQAYVVEGTRMRVASTSGPTLFFTSITPPPPQPTETPETPEPTETGETPEPTETGETPEPTETAEPPAPTDTQTVEDTPTATVEPEETPTPEPPTAVISAPAAGQAGQPVTFDGSGSTSEAGFQSYAWDFGDGSPPAEGAAVDHAFAAANVYTVTLTVTDVNGVSDSTTWDITIS